MFNQGGDGSEGGVNTISETFPGAGSTDMYEVAARAGSPTKPSRITSGEADASKYLSAFLPASEIETYNPSQLYYT
jgi:hypothetical protein